MKRLLSIIMATTMILSMNVLTFAEETHEITKATFPLYNDINEMGIDMTLYFLDGATDLPYIEVNDWQKLIDGFFDTPTKHIGFSLKADGSIVTYTRNNDDPEAVDNGATMMLDFDKDYVEFNDYNLFCKRGISSTILDMVTLNVFNEAGEPALLEKVDTGSFTRYGNALMIPLADYGIDLVAQDGLYLIPLQTLSDVIMPNTSMGDFYFNGKCVILSTDVNDCSDLYYDAPTGERSEALTNYGYGELCMMLDYFYGLKDAHNIENFDKLFHDVGLESVLKGQDVKLADAGIFRLISDFLSDGHSKWHAFSYLAGPDEISANDITRERISEHLSRQKAARAEYYPDGIPGYEEVGNTAYITFDNFTYSGNPNADAYYEVEDAQEFPDSDVIGLIIKAHEMINREDSPIENVVLDLSANTGGADNAATFAIAWFLGKASVSTLDNLTGAMCTSVYRADVNRDRVFDEKDTVADKNLVCLISPCSFSNGNFVPCAFKDSGKVTLLGRTSAGGSCTVLNASSAWGTSFQISGPLRVSFLKNGSFYDVDSGADPDYVLATPEKYYDRQALTDYINTLF